MFELIRIILTDPFMFIITVVCFGAAWFIYVIDIKPSKKEVDK